MSYPAKQNYTLRTKWDYLFWLYITCIVKLLNTSLKLYLLEKKIIGSYKLQISTQGLVQLFKVLNIYIVLCIFNNENEIIHCVSWLKVDQMYRRR